MILFASPSNEELYTHRQLPSLVECPNDSSKMNLFEGTNCLVCSICGELRWLV